MLYFNSSSANLPPLSHRSPGALCSVRAPSVHCKLGDQNFSLGAPLVGEVSLLKNDHSVQDIPVQKMYPLCCPRRRLSWASLQRAAPRASLGREGHAIRPRLFRYGRGFPILFLLCRLPVLCHPMPRQISSRHILPAIPSLYPFLISSHSRRVPLPSYVVHTPPLTGSPPPGMGGRPCQLSS